ncbi:MAG: hypothetical protein CO103_03210 [Chloroflexi bacterium CG_4_9_14_3_um_filter_45_9]|nr:MAG: hypothetical protein AUK00_01210 [Dehalococcoidia bacterium CG2_30_46_9]PIU22867.1 MAG: hypothetical protein COT13_06175 [Chloroflexi bacterium CG08_land_8_20_14_0_20_45_12]PIX27474.1 MAG: hypothetical protein COZ67_02125 [Chloroflexi bacterium CG_4_8_14_3_um_filter_45_15]PJB50159.1 MAG: hypothetical protein CO103_03210 [Chloroflexi bacterium CG_4_9_14_3_um_filter_45_9]
MDSKDKRERALCQAFLAWYNRQHNTAYEGRERAEDRYPELRNEKQRLWDFICYERGVNDWIAVEIKELVNPKALQGVSRPLKIVKRVEKKCAGKLTGVYWLNLPPIPKIEQGKQEELVECLCGVLAREEPLLKDGEHVSVGPRVEQCLGWELWPANSFPLEIYLTKVRDDSTRLFLKSFAGWTEPTIPYAEEIERLVKSADGQLAEAKERGASKTFLVFVCQFPPEEQLQDDVLHLPKDHQLNIDHIYLMHDNEVFPLR